MKKLTLSLALAALTTSAVAATGTYQSPALRGEITQAIKPQDTINLLEKSVKGLPVPSISVSEVKTIPTVVIPANTSGSTILDVTLVDELLDDVAPNARHYPTNFPTRTSEYLVKQNIKHLSDWIEPYASAPDASAETLLRAAKINGMARNLNLGNDYTVRAGNHMQKLLQVDPNHTEGNFLFGMMLSESGAFKEGRKYLDKAVAAGYTEAEQSIAQAELLGDNRSGALKRLQKLAAAHPDNAQIAEQVRIVENGGYYIWNIPDVNLNIKAPQTAK